MKNIFNFFKKNKNVEKKSKTYYSKNDNSKNEEIHIHKEIKNFKLVIQNGKIVECSYDKEEK